MAQMITAKYYVDCTTVRVLYSTFFFSKDDVQSYEKHKRKNNDGEKRAPW